MSVIITNTGVLGPFSTIEVLEDRLRCDDTEYPFTVIGEHTISEDDGLAPTVMAAKSRDTLKTERQDAVAAIKVTTQAGHAFDGDEISQTRMSRAIDVLTTLTDRLASGEPITLPAGTEQIYRVVGGAYETIWILADNSPAFIGKGEIQEALALAGAAQAAIWVI